MRWHKLGHVFSASGQFPWMQTHAAVPFAEPLAGKLVTVYFSSRDARNRSSTGQLVLELGDVPKIIEIDSEPLIAPGKLGCFDDDGAMLSWIERIGTKRYFYYIGWNRGVSVPFRNAIGLAIAEGRGRPVRYADGPIVDRTAFEPHFTASSCVLRDGTLWRMWYLSCTGWVASERGPDHYYHLKYAESDDGIVWRRNGRVAIEYDDSDERAISRPSVLRDGDLWRMWYSCRGGAYKIGYAESMDGISWNRLDHRAGIGASSSGWDSEMIEYPHVFDHQGRRFMLYNGNDFGKTGFGIAVLE